MLKLAEATIVSQDSLIQSYKELSSLQYKQIRQSASIISNLDSQLVARQKQIQNKTIYEYLLKQEITSLKASNLSYKRKEKLMKIKYTVLATVPIIAYILLK